MKQSKMDELTRCYAGDAQNGSGAGGGGGYDISGAQALATSLSSNVTAGTIFNFGSGSVSNKEEQSSSASASASAARNLKGDTGSGDDGQPWHAAYDWPMIGLAVLAVAAIGGAVYYHYKKS